MAMKLLKLLFLLSITISMVAAASSADEKKEATTPGAVAAWSADGKSQNSATDSHLELPESPENYIELPESEESWTSSSDGASDSFGFPRKKTCDLFPQICHKHRSHNPDCCFKKCVNVMKDRSNCGECGRKCKHSEECCRGKCVNTSFDHRNCGKCGKACKKWEACIYGMCSYA